MFSPGGRPGRAGDTADSTHGGPGGLNPPTIGREGAGAAGNPIAPIGYWGSGCCRGKTGS
eukprot:9378092-Pyramimonas_sp.AAC.1